MEIPSAVCVVEWVNSAPVISQIGAACVCVCVQLRISADQAQEVYYRSEAIRPLAGHPVSSQRGHS